ncbi:hypothetical protein I4U23_017104 [Adineta vaga]|nr:hypothetical protein I4U23_017104 [Adineta vaga]
MSYFKSHLGAQSSLVELGLLVSKVGDFKRATHIYHLLLVELPNTRRDIDTAMQYYQKALNEMADTVGFSSTWFAIVQSNIALTYSTFQNFTRALIHYRCALFLVERKKDCYYSQRQPSEPIHFYLKAEQLIQRW